MADKRLFNDTVNLGVHTPLNMRDTVEIQYLAEIDLLMVNKNSLHLQSLSQKNF